MLQWLHYNNIIKWHEKENKVTNNVNIIYLYYTNKDDDCERNVITEKFFTMYELL